MYGLTFNGKHSFTDFGLIIYSKNRPILAEPKIITEDIQGMDGEYDFSEVNPDKRVKYKNKTHEIEFYIKESSLVSVREKAHQIANWLACGEKQLVYDDEPTVYYLGKIINRLDLDNQARTLKRFTAQFSCEPYAYSINQTTVNKAITGNTTITVNNSGTYVKPLIKVSGTCEKITFAVNGKTFSYNSPVIPSQALDIDCEKMIVAKGNQNVTKNSTGDFLELINGVNTIQVTGENLNCTVSVIFRPRYL